MPFVSKLDALANTLEKRGLVRYASKIDEVSNLLDEAKPSLDLSESAARNKAIGDPAFTAVGEALKKQVHSNNDSTILRKLDFFHADSKSGVLGMLRKIKALLKTGVELHQGDIGFLHKMQEVLSS